MKKTEVENLVEKSLEVGAKKEWNQRTKAIFLCTFLGLNVLEVHNSSGPFTELRFDRGRV